MFNTKITHQMDTVMDTILSFFWLHLWLTKQPQHSYMNRANSSQISPKKGSGPFFDPPHGTGSRGEEQRPSRHSLCKPCRDKRVSVGHVALRANAVSESFSAKPNCSPAPHPGGSMQNTHRGVWVSWESGTCACTQAGRRGNQADRRGWWSQTQKQRARGHLPHPSGCWVHSLCEGCVSKCRHLKKKKR